MAFRRIEKVFEFKIFFYHMSKSLEEGFNTFLNWISPLSTEHNKAQSHKDSVSSCLEKYFGCYSFFETGSFGNGTGVRHYSDTDYFAVIKTDKLSQNSSYTLRKVKEALQLTFWKTNGIEVNSPAVVIPFGTFTSETMEIIPCDFQGMYDTDYGKKPVYDIPNLSGGWMKSSPNTHNAYVKNNDIRLKNKLKPLIQLVKAWKFFNNVPISSFYLELRITKYAESEKSILYDIDIKRIMKYLSDINLASIQDPMGISGYINACNTDVKKEDALSKLSTGLSRVEKAYVQKDKDLDNCFYWWNLFFNNQFPSR